MQQSKKIKKTMKDKNGKLQWKVKKEEQELIEVTDFPIKEELHQPAQISFRLSTSETQLDSKQKSLAMRIISHEGPNVETAIFIVEQKDKKHVRMGYFQMLANFPRMLLEYLEPMIQLN